MVEEAAIGKGGPRVVSLGGVKVVAGRPPC